MSDGEYRVSKQELADMRKAIALEVQRRPRGVPGFNSSVWLPYLDDLIKAHKEIGRLRQGLWDCAAAAGMDTDGEATPRSLARPDIVELALREVRQLRAESDEYLADPR